jgi:predicted DNA-binding protein
MSKKSKSSHPIPVRIPEDMQEQIRRISKKSRLSEADIMRMAMDRGLSAVEKLFEPPAAQAA